MTRIPALRLTLVGLFALATGGAAYRGATDATATGQPPAAVAEGARGPDAARADYDKALAALKAALPRDDATLARFLRLQAQREEALTDELARLREEHAKALDQFTRDQAQAAAELARLKKDCEARLDKLKAKVAPVDLLRCERPKGKVVEVDAGQRAVTLDLGRADAVRPGLTFSVFGDGEYRPSGDRKASVEVSEVTGEHRCRARVTEIKNAARAPLAAGDLLYNPAWAPGLRDHVAVAGVIDLAGDGRDGTADLVRALEKEGVLVDAWLDPRDLKVRGRGISLQTSYLILGELPDVAGDEGRGRALEARAAVEQLHHEAVRHEVTVVSARRYLALAGMKVPRPVAQEGAKPAGAGDRKEEGSP